MESNEKATHFAFLLRKICNSIPAPRNRPNSGFLLESNCSLDSISEKEWNILSNNVSLNEKKKNYNLIFLPGSTIITQEESLHTQIFRIVSGTCKVIKNVPNPRSEEPQSIQITTLKKGDLFGEIGFFLGIRSIVSVIADSFVELQVLDSVYLKKLFIDDPIIILKFFYRVASNLANNLLTLSLDGWLPSEQ